MLLVSHSRLLNMELVGYRQGCKHTSSQGILEDLLKTEELQAIKMLIGRPESCFRKCRLFT
jgi:hypothetical protein